jgi:hypothetical protein
MVKTIPQLQIKKHLGNSHFCESIPRQKFGESNQQQQQPLILRVKESKILPETLFVKYSTSKEKKSKNKNLHLHGTQFE